MAKKKAKSASDSVDLSKFDFEGSMEELANIVGELEGGQLGLSGSLERYEQGVQYLKHCLQLLESAEQKISLLTGVDADGNPITEAYDNEEMDLENKAKSRAKRRTARKSTKKPKTDNVDDSGSLF
jgi:exodeoxyribonuclease VII small subunit